MRKAAVVGVILALAACNTEPADEPAPDADATQAAPAASPVSVPEPVPEPVPEANVPETVVVEVEPEIDTAQPIDSGRPVTDAVGTEPAFDPRPATGGAAEQDAE